MENPFHKKPASIKYLRSSGGVIFKKTDAKPEVALIATKNKTVWTLPKGIIDRGESPETTAAREIEEETGLKGEIIDAIGEKSYWFYLKEKNIRCKKTVTYFLLRHISGNTENYCSEVDEAKWFPIDEAVKLVSYKRDKEILEKAKERLEQSNSAAEQ
ncbi:MAG: NUDIX hydrolase [Thermodesulfovibrionales bacterium]|nr:NUDIX hydrolase [Thermodesulfovibrionales bacterium]